MEELHKTITSLQKQIEDMKDGNNDNIIEENNKLAKEKAALETKQGRMMEVIKNAKGKIETTEKKSKDLEAEVKAAKAQVETLQAQNEAYKKQATEMAEVKAQLAALAKQKSGSGQAKPKGTATPAAGGGGGEKETASVKPVIAPAPAQAAVRPTPIRQTASIQPTPASRGQAAAAASNTTTPVVSVVEPMSSSAPAITAAVSGQQRQPALVAEVRPPPAVDITAVAQEALMEPLSEPEPVPSTSTAPVGVKRARPVDEEESEEPLTSEPDQAKKPRVLSFGHLQPTGQAAPSQPTAGNKIHLHFIHI